MNGCFNRPPVVSELLVQDGWHNVFNPTHGVARMPNMVLVKNANSPDCRYSLTTVDANCAGCKRNQGPAR